jgi:hypothetical protein
MKRLATSVTGGRVSDGFSQSRFVRKQVMPAAAASAITRATTG